MQTINAAMTGWIYNFADYQRIYDLSPADLKKTILDFPAGVSSFNKEATERGVRVVSGDPAYGLTKGEMDVHAKELFANAATHLRNTRAVLKNEDDVALSKIDATWQQTIGVFLADFKVGLSEGRYQAIDFPRFTFDDHQFELALCSDLFFNAMFSVNEAWQSMLDELCRVAFEVRIFPLLDEKGQVTPVLGALMLRLQQQGFGVEVREVPYNMKKGGNAMLRVWSQHCVVE